MFRKIDLTGVPRPKEAVLSFWRSLAPAGAGKRKKEQWADDYRRPDQALRMKHSAAFLTNWLAAYLPDGKVTDGFDLGQHMFGGDFTEIQSRWWTRHLERLRFAGRMTGGHLEGFYTRRGKNAYGKPYINYHNGRETGG